MKGFRSTSGSDPKRSRKREQEHELISRAQEGDKQAIGELYRANVDVIYRYVWARVRDDSLAEDLTAQVFLKALEGLPTYQPSGKPFVAWLYRIAYARIVDHWRKLERRVEVPLEETLPSREPRPQELLEFEADWVTAMELLSQLTDDQQDVVILRFIGELSLADVALTVGKTVGATKALQYRALATLARLLEERRGSAPT
ncbi:MAG: sigma-70 family RNA polymerase sigma factor [Anaerolineae bacterium]|jgi:RNA polymerase sigma-70 factor (ECF subfamily)